MATSKNRHAGSAGLAWNSPNLADTNLADTNLALHSPDFDHEGPIPTVHAAKRAGGMDVSPALTWSPVPAGTAQVLLVVEDPDAPTATPYVHCVALLDPSVTSLPQGALDAANPPAGVRTRRGYLGPAPFKGHGRHRYVFQIFALATPASDAARPRDVLAAAGDILARGRLDGFYERA